jgi:hypothetical protein
MTRPAICRTPFAHESGVGGAFAGSGEGARGQPPGRRSRTARPRPPGTPSDLGAPPRVPEACASGCPERGSPPLGGTHRDERAPEVRRHATRDETTRRLASIAAASGGLPTGGGEAIAFSWRGASGRYSRKRDILRSHDCPGNRVRYALGQWSRSRSASCALAAWRSARQVSRRAGRCVPNQPYALAGLRSVARRFDPCGVSLRTR